MSKKFYLLLSLLVLASMLLAACGAPRTPEATQAPVETTAPEPVQTEPPAAAGEPEACASDAFGCATIAAGETIKIGMGAPMTGDNAQFGIDISQGATIAVQDAGEFEGFSFELVAEDDGGTPEGGASVANKLVSDPTVVAIAGHIFSGATASAIPIYEQAGLPMMSPSATNPDLTKSGSKVFNRLVFTDAAQGKFAAEFLYNELGFTKIAVMHDGQAYGQGLAQVVNDTFVSLGGEVTDFQAITPGESDYSAPLSAVAAKGPQALYYGGYVQEAVVLVNQMGSSGLTDTVFFGCDGTFGQDYLDRTGANGEGSYAVSLIPAASDAKTAFDAAYQAAFGQAPGVLSPYSWTAYDSAATLAAAVKEVAVLGGDGSLYIPRGALVDAVRGIADYTGLSGTVTCDATGECSGSGPTFYIVADGAWVPATEATMVEEPAGDPCADDAFGCATIAAGETIKIGMGAPMTGDNAQFGIDISQGATIAVQDAGEFEGFSFELVAEDDGGTPEGGASVANKLVSDPTVVAIAGHIFSGATASAIPIYEQAGLPMMSPSATNPDLTKSGSKVFNRLVFTDAAQGKFAAEYLFNELGFTKIAVMHDGQAYGQGLAQVVNDTFVSLGGEVTDFEAITPGESDYSAPLSAVAAKGPQALYYGGYVQEAVVLVNQMGSSGLTDTVFFGCDGTFGQDYLDRTGANGEGSYAVSLIPAASDAKTAFDAAYEAAFGQAPGVLSPYSWTAYDSAATLVAAIKSVAFVGDDGSLNIPRGALVDAVRSLKDYSGLSGTVTCDATGECSGSGPTFYIVTDGAWVAAQ